MTDFHSYQERIYLEYERGIQQGCSCWPPEPEMINDREGKPEFVPGWRVDADCPIHGQPFDADAQQIDIVSISRQEWEDLQDKVEQWKARYHRRRQAARFENIMRAGGWYKYVGQVAGKSVEGWKLTDSGFIYVSYHPEKKRMYNPHAGKWQSAGAWYEYARTGTTPAPF